MSSNNLSSLTPSNQVAGEGQTPYSHAFSLVIHQPPSHQENSIIPFSNEFDNTNEKRQESLLICSLGSKNDSLQIQQQLSPSRRRENQTRKVSIYCQQSGIVSQNGIEQQEQDNSQKTFEKENDQSDDNLKSFENPPSDFKVSETKIPQQKSRGSILLQKQVRASVQGQKMKKMLANGRASILQELEELDGEDLMKEVIILLKKPWKNRTFRDNKVITKCISRLQFFVNHFGKNHETMILDCSQNFKYLFCKAEDIVFKQGNQQNIFSLLMKPSLLFIKGEIGDKFYVILRGNVSVYVDFKKEEEKDKEEKNKGGGQDKEELAVLDRVHIRDFSEGESFGELALIERKPRSATITCLTDCHFITFDKNSFDRILKNEEIKRFKEEILSLKQNYLFSEYPINQLKTIFLLFQVVVYKKGDQIISEGDVSDRIFIIRDGEFKVSKKIYVKIDDEAANSLNANFKRRQVNSIDLGILCSHQSFGEEEFFSREPVQVNVTCFSSKGEVMILNRREFIKKMGYDFEQIKRMEKAVSRKKSFRDAQFEKVVNTFGQVNQKQILDKRGQFINCALSSVEQEQIRQKEIIENQNRETFNSGACNYNIHSSNKQNEIIRYHFVRKKVTNSQSGTDPLELQALSDSFYSLNQSPKLSNKRERVASIASPFSQSKASNFAEENQRSQNNTHNNTHDSINQSNCESLTPISQKSRNQNLHFRKLEMGLHSSQIREKRKSLFEAISWNKQQSSENGTPKEIYPSISTSRFNEDSVISQEPFKFTSFSDKIQEFQTEKSSGSEYTKTLNKEELDSNLKDLIEKEMQSQNFFLNKRKKKQTETTFFGTLEESLEHNKNHHHHHSSSQSKQKSIQLRELFSQANRQLRNSKNLKIGSSQSSKSSLTSSFYEDQDKQLQNSSQLKNEAKDLNYTTINLSPILQPISLRQTCTQRLNHRSHDSQNKDQNSPVTRVPQKCSSDQKLRSDRIKPMHFNNSTLEEKQIGSMSIDRSEQYSKDARNQIGSSMLQQSMHKRESSSIKHSQQLPLKYYSSTIKLQAKQIHTRLSSINSFKANVEKIGVNKSNQDEINWAAKASNTVGFHIKTLSTNNLSNLFQPINFMIKNNSELLQKSKPQQIEEFRRTNPKSLAEKAFQSFDEGKNSIRKSPSPNLRQMILK